MLLRVLVSLAAVLITIFVCEAGLRLAGLMPEYNLKLKTIESDAGKLHIVLDARRLYRVKPRSRDDINNYGYRDVDFSQEKRGKRILLLGDSFIMGNNLEVSQTVPKQLERMLGMEVLNMGVSGYGPDQELVALEEDGLALEPDLVVLALFAGNDLRDLSQNGLFDADAQDRLTMRAENPVTRALPRTRLQMLLRVALQGRYLDSEAERALSRELIEDKEELLQQPLTAENRRQLELMRAILTEFKRILGERGIPLYVVIIPAWTSFETLAKSGRVDFKNEQELAKICAAVQAPCLDLSGAFRAAGGIALYDPAYRHLNAAGAEAAAAQIAEQLKLGFPGPVGENQTARAAPAG